MQGNKPFLESSLLLNEAFTLPYTPVDCKLLLWLRIMKGAQGPDERVVFCFGLVCFFITPDYFLTL